MNFLQCVQRVHAESMRSTAAPLAVTGQTVRNQRIVDAVADAWIELQSERDWRWMRETTDAPLTIGQQVYTATELSATRFGRWRVEDATYCVYVYRTGFINAIHAVTYLNLDEFRQKYVYRTWGPSTPIAWTFDETNRMLVGPTPGIDYNIRAEFWKEPSVLATENDTPDMPERFHMLLVWRALIEVAKADAAAEILNRAESNYTKLHAKLMFDQARLPYVA